jgi:hypothetical protein
MGWANKAASARRAGNPARKSRGAFCIERIPFEAGLALASLKLDFSDPRTEHVDSRQADIEEESKERKRLKERLKEAMMIQQRKSNATRVLMRAARERDWLEVIFGICAEDARLGKEGSR